MIQILIIILVICAFIKGTVNAKMKLSKNVYHVWILAASVVYFLGYLYFTVICRLSTIEVYFEWKPFASYIRMLEEAQTVGDNSLAGWPAEFFLAAGSGLRGIVLNILLYIPLGYLMPKLFCGLSNKQVLLSSFFVTFCTELIQLIAKLGWCETDDLIHNMLGAVIGLAVHRWQEQKVRLKESP